MARKRMLDDKATWRTDTGWGIDPAQPARAERIFDPNDAVTDDPTAGGIAGLTDPRKITKAVAVLRTDQQADPSQAISKAYQ